MFTLPKDTDATGLEMFDLELLSIIFSNLRSFSDILAARLVVKRWKETIDNINHPIPGQVIKIAAAGAHSIFLTRSNGVYIAGENWNYHDTRLPTGAERRQGQSPKQIPSNYFMGKRITEVMASEFCTFFLSEDGNVFTCGLNSDGQLACDKEIHTLIFPKLIPSEYFQGKQIIKAAAGNTFAVFLGEDSSIFICGSWSWIRGNKVQSIIPEKIDLRHLTNIFITDLVASGEQIAFLTKNGHVYTWGFGNNLGHPKASYDAYLSAPRQIDPKYFQYKPIIKVAMDARISIFLAEDGSVFGCGDSRKGHLGGKVGYFETPVPIDSVTFENRRIVDIAVGCDYGIFLTEDGSVFSWGENRDSLCPPQKYFKSDHRIIMVAAGVSHAVLLAEDGMVFTSGSNYHGELGHQGQQYCFSPTPVDSLYHYFCEAFFLRKLFLERWETLKITCPKNTLENRQFYPALPKALKEVIQNIPYSGNNEVVDIPFVPPFTLLFQESRKALEQSREKILNTEEEPSEKRRKIDMDRRIMPQ